MFENEEIKIESVREAGDGFYWLNGTTHVPPAPGNLEYKAIQKWIASGNKPIQYTRPEPGPEPEQPITASTLVKIIKSLPKQSRRELFESLKGSIE
jgi:hypothetical protein